MRTTPGKSRPASPSLRTRAGIYQPRRPGCAATSAQRERPAATDLRSAAPVTDRRTTALSETARLSGTGLVADDLYLMAHDDVTGRPFLQPRAVGNGPGGRAAGRADAAGQAPPVARAGGGGRPGAAMGRARASLSSAWLLSERERHPVRDWLAFLARTAETDVAVRLERAGYLLRPAPAGPGALSGGCRWIRTARSRR